ncbi:MAG: hypothetical protein FWD05_02500 [Oscillospiraceae bacterium]|nr:hypothetical protein [Oscillospiraceae bacterium]
MEKKIFSRGMIGMVNNDFLGGLINVVYYIIYSAMAAIIIFIVMWLFVKLKRWCARARIRRSKEDFVTEAKYIRDVKKKPNFIQQFILSQTGIVEKPKDYALNALVFVISGGVGIMFFGIVHLSNIIINDHTRYIIWLVFSAIALIFTLVYWVRSLKALIKYMRVLPFLLLSFVLLMWVLVLINAIMDLIIL